MKDILPPNSLTRREFATRTVTAIGAMAALRHRDQTGEGQHVDVALLDARKALDMFNSLRTPVLGLVENMSTYVCPNCGHEAHLFGHGGVRAEAEKINVPFLGQLPIDLDTRLAGDAGIPIAAGNSPMAEAYAQLADRLVKGGMA